MEGLGCDWFVRKSVVDNSYRGFNTKTLESAVWNHVAWEEISKYVVVQWGLGNSPIRALSGSPSFELPLLYVVCDARSLSILIKPLGRVVSFIRRDAGLYLNGCIVMSGQQVPCFANVLYDKQKGLYSFLFYTSSLYEKGFVVTIVEKAGTFVREFNQKSVKRAGFGVLWEEDRPILDWGVKDIMLQW